MNRQCSSTYVIKRFVTCVTEFIHKCKYKSNNSSVIDSIGLSPPVFYTDRSKAVLLLWFLTVLAVFVYTLVHLLC